MSPTATDGPLEAEWPAVAVVMPIRNEATHLEAAITAILDQCYRGPLEICLAVAPSDDDTDTIAAELAARDPRITVVANPAGITPAGLNAAIAATTAGILVRVDGHARLSPGYITRAVETLARTGAVNVGGVQRAVGTTPMQRAIATAMTSPLGVGGARFHLGGVEGPVDTVYLGVFRREALEAVGGFDETLIRNQDYELNIRLREAGGTVWFDPELDVEYRPRPSLGALARQYAQYGAWKRHVLGLHPRSLRPRQAAPPLATAAITLSLLAAVRRPRALIVQVTYLSALMIGSTLTSRSSRRYEPVTDTPDAPPSLTPTWEDILRLTAALATMHLSWGVGFFIGGPLRRSTGR